MKPCPNGCIHGVARAIPAHYWGAYRYSARVKCPCGWEGPVSRAQTAETAESMAIAAWNQRGRVTNQLQ